MSLISYQPDYAIHPGKTLHELLVHIGMSQKDLAERTGLTEKHISEIIQEKSPITSETAIKLEFALTNSASFWLGLQKNFEETTTRLKLETQMLELCNEAAGYPYAEMAKLGWVEATKDRVKKVENLLKFLGVNDFGSVQNLQSAAFRKSNTYESSPKALAAWLRKAEIEAQGIDVKNFDRQKLLDFLPVMRKMTMQSPAEYRETLVDGLKACGIALVVIPHLKETRAHGATQWVSKDKAIIQLSLRGKYTDKFWFSLFHEIGHILRHGKKETYIQIEGNKDQTADEGEADAFASETLIPFKEYSLFIERKVFSGEDIKGFAERVGIHPGIVVGRLQIEKRVPYSHFNFLKGKYEWVEEK